MLIDKQSIDSILSATIAQLSNRVKERFPDGNLIQACDELLRLSRDTKLRAEWIGSPIISLRIVATILISLIAVALVSAFSQLNLSSGRLDVVVFVYFLNAGMNNIVISAAVVFFLITIEARVKRRRSLLAIHELRSR